ncbi:MAG: acyl-CoA desaturase [Moorea sp. SIOASIH]|nr:acyl-CoA desaturase [Moorena sp. SIOASIH]
MQLDSITELLTGSSKTQKIKIESEHLKTVGLLHAWAILLIPFLGLVVAIAQVSLSGIGAMEVGLLVGMYALTYAGITVGFHRQFAHCSFRTNTAVRVILAILGSMAAQGSVIYWVANHRRHHQYSDQSGDPHSPHLHGDALRGHLRGLWHAQIGWMFLHEFTNPLKFAKDLLRDPVISRVNRLYFWWIFLGLAVPAVLGGLLTWTWWGVFSGFLWGGLIRIFLVGQFTFFINSITHLYGNRTFDTREQSTNNIWIAIPTLGESWHNNHHAFPNSAVFGLKWWQIELGAWIVRALEKASLAWDIKVPTTEMLNAKKLV